MEIDKTILIEKPVKSVYQVLSNFSLWTFWSPWLVLDPDCKITLSGAAGSVGHSQEWKGGRVGSGQLVLKGISPHSRLELDLKLKRGAVSKVWFELSQLSENQTQVHWKMAATVPWFLIFLKKFLVMPVLSQVGHDFERGLLLLKDFCETGSSGCRLEFPKSQLTQSHLHRVDSFSMAGIPTSGALSQISELIQTACTKLYGPAGLLKDKSLKEGICLCHDFDRMRDRVNFTIGNKLESSQTPLSEPLVGVHMESHDALMVTLVGPYKHLSTAWQAIKLLQKSLKYRPHPTIAPYEVYISDPLKTPAQELTTQIYLPIQVPT